ncbi:hypothetical protein BY458DRAFT_556994 [Sporodiniella umbellata]|nr:hypothetical protein BY458DRAFT_556994 [Sporodiniella umbellata]
MYTEIKAPGEKVQIDSLYDYLESPTSTLSQRRTNHTVSTAHFSSDQPGDDYDRLVSFCGVLTSLPVTEPAVLTLAANVFTLVHSDVQDLQRRTHQILYPTRDHTPLSSEDYHQLISLAQAVRTTTPKNPLVILDHDPTPSEPEPHSTTVHYTSRTPSIQRPPWATSHSFDQYDQDVTPFDSELEE